MFNVAEGLCPSGGLTDVTVEAVRRGHSRWWNWRNDAVVPLHETAKLCKSSGDKHWIHDLLCQIMKVHVLEREQFLPITMEEAWAFFSTPRNLDEITPPDLGFFIEHCEDGPMFEGQVITYRIKVAPLVWVSWVTEIRAVEEGVSFVDNQMCGPYKLWHHRHSFEEVDGGVLMRDRVHYGLGFGPFGTLAHALFVGGKVKEIFASRRKYLEERFGAAKTN